jgi:hypothetical protein
MIVLVNFQPRWATAIVKVRLGRTRAFRYGSILTQEIKVFLNQNFQVDKVGRWMRLFQASDLISLGSIESARFEIVSSSILMPFWRTGLDHRVRPRTRNPLSVMCRRCCSDSSLSTLSQCSEKRCL